MKDRDIHAALVDLVEGLQESGLDLELEAGQNGLGPVARALIAMGEKNIYEITEIEGFDEN